jgi:hypothetical protein
VNIDTSYALSVPEASAGGTAMGEEVRGRGVDVLSGLYTVAAI